MKLLLLITLSTAITLTSTLAIAQPNFQYPQPNRQGDYTSIFSKLQDGTKSLHYVWKVVSSELNCRAQAGGNYPVVRTLSKGDNIDIVGKPKIYRDKQGKTWLYVAKEGSAEDVKIRCFVRANTQFIKPIPYSIY
ncbi:MAG: hypothetical protein V7L01_12285 [Nostoc sp.]|uniref:hypothetical protein n=1 Tax=Nostoc sp. TaxID=1180 RepID=UPI002FF9D59C